MYKYEMHVHTSECDVYAAHSGAEIVRMYHEAGYSGLVVTDHSFSAFYEWFADELKGASHEKKVERWLKGYDSARNEGEKLGFTVLPGAEVRFDGSPNDYLVYGVDERFFYDAPILSELKDLRELKAVLPENACIVQAHPFRHHMMVADIAPLWGIEVYNGGTEPRRNELAHHYARLFEKGITSGSDFHHQSSLGRGGIISERPILTPLDLTDVLRNGAYALIENT